MNTSGLTAAGYGTEVPSFGWAGGEAPRFGISIWVSAVVFLKILLWKAVQSIDRGAEDWV